MKSHLYFIIYVIFLLLSASTSYSKEYLWGEHKLPGGKYSLYVTSPEKVQTYRCEGAKVYLKTLKTGKPYLIEEMGDVSAFNFGCSPDGKRIYLNIRENSCDEGFKIYNIEEGRAIKVADTDILRKIQLIYKPGSPDDWMHNYSSVQKWIDDNTCIINRSAYYDDRGNLDYDVFYNVKTNKLKFIKDNGKKNRGGSAILN